ncbi:hypothetical protein [Streptomyces katsurahamanus]|uniref:Uncharacterized protein n=1 Tax=Streptomyces katsurahamanus TaxID=2577098 RepID=A0ABW9NXE2_9ACTN|nr:hypothetical protein [Streptomyces katsurahamanus]MQS37524.1 hypothetical protein [Streptomyces katsurahamanus]
MAADQVEGAERAVWAVRRAQRHTDTARTGRDVLDACHWALLRQAGRAPDDRLAEWRGRLARGEVLAAARAVLAWAAADRVPLPEPDLTTLTGVVVAAGEHPPPSPPRQPRQSGWTGEGDRGGGGGGLPYAFLAGRAVLDSAATADEPRSHALLLFASQSHDPIDTVLAMAASDESAVRAVWRCLRMPEGAPWPPARTARVFVVETDRGAELAGITGRLQDALAAAGEESPRVEVCPRGAELPEYQAQARLAGALIWARESGTDGGAGGGIAGRGRTADGGTADGCTADGCTADGCTADGCTADGGDGDPPGPPADGVWVWSGTSACFVVRYGLDLGPGPGPGPGPVERGRRHEHTAAEFGAEDRSRPAARAHPARTEAAGRVPPGPGERDESG